MALSVPEKAIGEGYDFMDLSLPFADETRSGTERAGGGSARTIALPGILSCLYSFAGSLTGGGSKALLASARQSAMAVALEAIGQRANEEFACQYLGWWFPVQASPEVVDRIAAKVRQVSDPDLVEGRT